MLERKALVHLTFVNGDETSGEIANSPLTFLTYLNLSDARKAENGSIEANMMTFLQAKQSAAAIRGAAPCTLI